MVCKQCGTQLSASAKFCSACGSAVAVEPEIHTEILQQETQADVQENEQAEVQVKIQAEIQPEAQVKVPSQVQTDFPTETPKIKKAKKENKFLRGFLSVICCLMIFIFSMTTLSLLVVRGTLAEDNVKNLLDNVDIEDIVNEATMKNFDDYIEYDSVEDIYKKSSIKNYVKKIATQYTNYLLGGAKPDGIEADDIIELMEANQDDLEEIMDRPITERDYESALEFFEENGEENLGILSAESRNNDVLFFPRLALSIFAVVVFILITFLFVFLLLKVRRFRLDTMVWTAVPLILTALIIGIFGSIKPLTIALLGDVEPIVEAATRVIMSGMLSSVLADSGILLLIGVLLITVYILIKKIINAKAKKKMIASDSVLA